MSFYSLKMNGTAKGSSPRPTGEEADDNQVLGLLQERSFDCVTGECDTLVHPGTSVSPVTDFLDSSITSDVDAKHSVIYRLPH